MCLSESPAAPARRLAALVIGSLVLALAWASPAAAVDPGAVKLDRKTGCPLFYYPSVPNSQASPLLFPPHGEHCVQLAAPSVLPLQRFFPSSTPGGIGGCAGSLLVQEAIPKGTDDWVILPFSDIGLGTQILRPPGQRSISIFNGADTYRAPPGSVVYGLGGGSNAGPCQPWDTHILGAEAWGVTFKWLIDGHVTVQGSGTAAPKIRVDAGCSGGSGGGTTTTDSKGYYQFLVDQNTTCTVTPRLINGLKSTPPHRVVHVHRADVHHADFQVPCDAVPASADVATAASKSSLGGCPLKVIISLDNKLRSGLRIHQPFTNYPADFVEPVNGRFACSSGCGDVTVTVFDPRTHQRVPNATVFIKVSGITGEKGSSGADYICTTSSNRCGVGALGNLTTNSLGQVYVRYWLPGFITATKVKFDANATACSSSCPLGGPKFGQAKPLEVTAQPYLIYQQTADIPEEQALDLAAWAGGTRFFTRFLKVATIGPKVLPYVFEWLKEAEVAAERATQGLELVEKAEPIFGLIELLKVGIELNERNEMIAMYLHDAKLDPIGIGEGPFEAAASAPPAFGFTKHLVNYGVVAPFDLGADGVWWGFALGLHHINKGGDLFRTGHPLLEGWSVRTTIYETSHCDPTIGSCGPGWGGLLGTNVATNPGMQPELTFQVDYILHGRDYVRHLFTVPYDAPAWTEQQQGLRGVIKDS